jgi:hypothetical protein
MVISVMSAKDARYSGPIVNDVSRFRIIGSFAVASPSVRIFNDGNTDIPISVTR